MKPLARSLRDYPPAMLRAIAEVNDLSLASNVARQMVEQLTSFLGDPARLDGVLAACSPAASQALAVLMRDGGRSSAAGLRASARGDSRHWARPAGAREAAPCTRQPNRGTLVPRPDLQRLCGDACRHGRVPLRSRRDRCIAARARAGDRRSVSACVPSTRCRSTRERFPAARSMHAAVFDSGRRSSSRRRRRLDFLAAHFPIRATSPLVTAPCRHEEDLHDGPGHPAVLALALANDLGWLQPRNRRMLALHAGAVRSWLEAPREQQRRIVMDAWQASQAWNDLCRTPSLVCEETGSWHNDPVATRAASAAVCAVGASRLV